MRNLQHFQCISHIFPRVHFPTHTLGECQCTASTRGLERAAQLHYCLRYGKCILINVEWKMGKNQETRKIEKCVQWQMENALLKSLALIAFALLTTNLRLATARGLRDDPARWRERERMRERAKEVGRERG